MHRVGGELNFGRKRRKKQKIFKKMLWEKFFKMLNGDLDPGQAAGTVFRPKIVRSLIVPADILRLSLRRLSGWFLQVRESRL